MIFFKKKKNLTCIRLNWILHQHMKRRKKPDAAQKKWQNITSLFNKAALSVLLISNILPQILVKRNRKKPLQALCLQRVLQFSCAQQNSQYVISLEFAHYQAKKRTIMFQWAVFFFARCELAVKTEALINFAVECQKKMLWRSQKLYEVEHAN